MVYIIFFMDIFIEFIFGIYYENLLFIVNFFLWVLKSIKLMFINWISVKIVFVWVLLI